MWNQNYHIDYTFQWTDVSANVEKKSLSWFVMSGHNSYPQTQTLFFLDLILPVHCDFNNVKCMWKKLSGWNSEEKKNICKGVYYETQHEMWVIT